MAMYSGVFPLKKVIFHSYVSLPEGKHDDLPMKHGDLMR